MCDLAGFYPLWQSNFWAWIFHKGYLSATTTFWNIQRLSEVALVHFYVRNAWKNSLTIKN